jgi:hypothetical protein
MTSKEAEMRETLVHAANHIHSQHSTLGSRAECKSPICREIAAALAGQGQPEPDVRHEDCRLVCERCAKGDIPTVMTTATRGDLYFHTPEDSKSYVCLATKIWANIAAQPTQPEAAASEWEPSLSDLTHTRSCPALNPCDEDPCTCGLEWRIRLRTAMELRNAWEKRAYQAERELRAAQPEAKGEALETAMRIISNYCTHTDADDDGSDDCPKCRKLSQEVVTALAAAAPLPEQESEKK